MPLREEIPALEGTTANRLLAVRLEVPVHFAGVQLQNINTQIFGLERYNAILVDMSLIALRVHLHRGVPFLMITYDGKTRGVGWHHVRDFTAHPDFQFDVLTMPPCPPATATPTKADSKKK